MDCLGPIIESISNLITDKYLKRFPFWPSSGSQEDYIDIFTRGCFEPEKGLKLLKFYWVCDGDLLVKDTKYDPPKDGNYYKAEYSGKPEFQLAYFDLEKIRLCNEMVKIDKEGIKQLIDDIENKLLEVKIKKLLIDTIDINDII